MYVGANPWPRRAFLAEQSSQKVLFPHARIFVLVISSDNVHCSEKNGGRRIWPAPGSLSPQQSPGRRRSCSAPGPAAAEPHVPLSRGGDTEPARQGPAGRRVRALSLGKCTQAWHRQRPCLSASALPCCHSTLRAVIGPLLCHPAVALNTFSLRFLFSCPPPSTHFTEISE